MLVYIEFYSRRPGVSLEAFHRVAGQGQTGWASGYAEDQLVLNVGRTWRVGPEPEYLAAWYTPNAGLDRLDGWERIFKSGQADPLEEPFRLVAQIDAAGCYRPLLEPVPGPDGPYYAEYFEVRSEISPSELEAVFQKRRDRHPSLKLHLALDRVGKLGPDPRGLAFWGLKAFADAEQLAQELDRDDQPLRLIKAGLYADFGQEVL